MRDGNTHGRRARGRRRGRPGTGASSSSRGQGSPALASSSATGDIPQIPTLPSIPQKPKLPSILWDRKAYHPRTARLIEWCKINEDARLKIFSDSSKDAKQEGRPRQQMSTQKEVYLQKLATSIFEHDEDPVIRALFSTNPLAFIKPVQSRFVSLRKKYNEFNAQLGRTGAGMSLEELEVAADDKVKVLLDKLLAVFPWWTDLHGWWRTNPAYNVAFSTADPGQDFSAEALSLFRGTDKGKGAATCSSYADDIEDGDVEDGEGPLDDELPDDELEPGELTEKHTSNSDPPTRQPDSEHVTKPGSVTFFSLNSPTNDRPRVRRSFLAPTHPTPPSLENHDTEMMNPSDDSDTAASRMLNTLTVHSRKASASNLLGHRVAHASGGHTTATSSNNTSEAESPTLHGLRAGMGSASSRKRSRGDLQADLTAIDAVADLLAKKLEGSTSTKADTKRLRLQSKLASRELKAREAHNEREHALRAAMTAHDHERAMADERTRQLELEIKLEQARMERIALEREVPQKD